MTKPTVQDIFHRFYPRYLEHYSPSSQQAKVAHCIINCKTGAYGTNVSICEDCGQLEVHYNSCRNRSYTEDLKSWLLRGRPSELFLAKPSPTLQVLSRLEGHLCLQSCK